MCVGKHPLQWLKRSYLRRSAREKYKKNHHFYAFSLSAPSTPGNSFPWVHSLLPSETVNFQFLGWGLSPGVTWSSELFPPWKCRVWGWRQGGLPVWGARPAISCLAWKSVWKESLELEQWATCYLLCCRFEEFRGATAHLCLLVYPRPLISGLLPRPLNHVCCSLSSFDTLRMAACEASGLSFFKTHLLDSTLSQWDHWLLSIGSWKKLEGPVSQCRLPPLP